MATNAVLERRGARVGLIATDGFRYLLHLAEAWTPGPLFGFMVYDKPEPLVELEDVREVPERLSTTGEVRRELDEMVVRAAIAELRDEGVEALTVSLINSFANPAHERARPPRSPPRSHPTFPCRSPPTCSRSSGSTSGPRQLS